MKELTLLLALLIGSIPSFAQSHCIAKGPLMSTTLDDRGEVLIFNIDPTIAQKAQDKSDQLNLTIPFFNGSEIDLILDKVQIYSDHFAVKLKSKKGEQVASVEKGLHYRGKIKNVEHSRVSISIFSGVIAGVIHYKGNSYDLGPSAEGAGRHFITKSNIEQARDYLKCSTEYDPTQVVMPDYSQKTSIECSTATEIYFECDYDMYLNFGSDTATSNYVTSLFTEVSTIFANDSIPLLISEIVIWVEEDPYTDDVNAITEFANDLNANGFNGHLAQLLTNDPGANGGIAFVDVLCGANPYAYSDINNLHDPYPTYSWDVQVVTHELGHNFGSPHTHDCAWGTNGTEQIDDCGNIAQGGGPCYDSDNPIVPSNGGTIMSYCHLNGVGINFANGFGPQPGALLRAKHASCLCDNATCDSANQLILDGNYYVEPSSGNGASTPNATHADWFYYIPDQDGTISVASCGENEDTRLWIHTGTCDNLNYEILSDDDCDMGGGSNYASEIIDFPVTAGTKYYIEWDDRWSQGDFDMVFSYLPLPQLPNCNGDTLMITGTVIDSISHAEFMLSADATIQGTNNTFKAGETIEFLPGFEIQTGAELTVEIGQCQDNN